MKLSETTIKAHFGVESIICQYVAYSFAGIPTLNACVICCRLLYDNDGRRVFSKSKPSKIWTGPTYKKGSWSGQRYKWKPQFVCPNDRFCFYSYSFFFERSTYCSLISFSRRRAKGSSFNISIAVLQIDRMNEKGTMTCFRLNESTGNLFLTSWWLCLFHNIWYMFGFLVQCGRILQVYGIDSVHTTSSLPNHIQYNPF